MKRVIIVAGDKSGDLYGGFLSKKLREKCSSLEIISFGGDNLFKYSHYQIINLVNYSTIGLFEIVFYIKKFINLLKKTVEEIEKIKPDLIILIDFPDFNLRLAKILNKKFPLFYYVSPQVWAWRKKRINLIKKYIDRMIVVFEFEKEFYEKEKVDVFYFGHPLLEIVKKINPQVKEIISFLPGSRKNEIKRHLPVMEKAKKILEKELKGYSFRIIRPPHIEEEFYKNLKTTMNIVEHNYSLLEESKFIIASSGTTTLEIALLEVPFLIIYRVNPLTWFILKKLVKTNFIGMVNILASKKIVEELLQKKACPEKIAQLTLNYLKDEKKYSQLKENLKEIKTLLSPHNATENLANFIIDYLSS
ncbi:MAG TPA: lipid-A-disaccharide synthase [Candidatus Omnitrophica bacterium]|nr:lipid-A-disaccharide synthase [Candidatus Omnitrophota bacterium]